MGADNPKTGKPVTKNLTPFTLLLIGLAVLLVGIMLYPKTDFEEGDIYLTPLGFVHERFG